MAVGRIGTNQFSTANYIVDTDGIDKGATHTTIQGAIDDASAGESIFVRPGTYTENLTLKDDICLQAYGQTNDSGNAAIVGKISAGTADNASLIGFRMTDNGDVMVEDTGAGSGGVTFERCSISGDGSHDIINNTNSSRSFNFFRCTLSQPSGAKIFNYTGGTLSFRYSIFSAGSSTISTISAGTVNFSHCLGVCPFQTTGTGNYNAQASTFSSNNQICIDHQGAAQAVMQMNSLRTNGTVAAMNIGAGATVVTTELTINTNNNTPISGAGTIWYDKVGFIQGGNHTIAPTRAGGATRIGLLRLATALDEVYGGTGNNTYATGDLLYASAANTLSKLAAGVNGDVLTLAAGVPSWATPAGGGGAWEFISTATASSSASIEFTNLTSTYFKYMIVFDRVIPATDGASMYVRTSSNNGTSYDSGATDYAWNFIANDTTTTAGADDGQGESFIAVTQGTIDPGSGANEGMQGVIELINPSDTSYTCVLYRAAGFDNGAESFTVNGGGFRQSAADVDAIQILFSSGNIASGTFKLYGLNAT